MVKQWYGFPVFNPDGTQDKPVLALGKGDTESEAYLNAESSARMTAATRDGDCHSGSRRTVGKGEKHAWPYGVLVATCKDGTTTIMNMETKEVKTWLPDSVAPLQ